MSGLGRREYFALAFGSTVGVGWIVGLGSWLRDAGPVGALIAFGFGGAATLVVASCYARVVRVLPLPGGEAAYAFASFGTEACYWTAWVLAFTYVGTIVFEAVSMSGIISLLFVGADGPVLYSVEGEAVHVGTLVFGIVGVTVFTLLNTAGLRVVARAQDLMTYGRLAIFGVALVAAVVFGNSHNLLPPFASTTSPGAIGGMAAVLLTVPFWLAGFNTLALVVTERSMTTTAADVGRLFSGTVIGAVAFYAMVIVACSMTMPWQRLAGLPIPAAQAFGIGLRAPYLANAILIVALFGLFTTWNSCVLAASRLLATLGEARLIPAPFATYDRNAKAATFAAGFIGVVTAIGIIGGKGVLSPVVDAVSTGLALVYLLVSLVLLKHARTAAAGMPNVRLAGLAGASVLVSVGMLVLSLWQPYVDAGYHPPLEWWISAAWLAVGVVFRWTRAGAIRRDVLERAFRNPHTAAS